MHYKYTFEYLKGIWLFACGFSSRFSYITTRSPLINLRGKIWLCKCSEVTENGKLKRGDARPVKTLFVLLFSCSHSCIKSCFLPFLVVPSSILQERYLITLIYYLLEAFKSQLIIRTDWWRGHEVRPLIYVHIILSYASKTLNLLKVGRLRRLVRDLISMSSCCKFLWFEGFTTAVRRFHVVVLPS